MSLFDITLALTTSLFACCVPMASFFFCQMYIKVHENKAFTFFYVGFVGLPMCLILACSVTKAFIAPSVVPSLNGQGTVSPQEIQASRVPLAAKYNILRLLVSFHICSHSSKSSIAHVTAFLAMHLHIGCSL